MSIISSESSWPSKRALSPVGAPMQSVSRSRAVAMRKRTARARQAEVGRERVGDLLVEAGRARLPAVAAERRRAVDIDHPRAAGNAVAVAIVRDRRARALQPASIRSSIARPASGGAIRTDCCVAGSSAPAIERHRHVRARRPDRRRGQHDAPLRPACPAPPGSAADGRRADRDGPRHRRSAPRGRGRRPVRPAHR